MSTPLSPAYGRKAPQAQLAAGATRADDILTPDALALVASLARAHGASRDALLEARTRRRHEVREGAVPDLCPATAAVREGDWTIGGGVPSDLMNRRVEITGPANAKLMVSALNSGASVFMADLEDSLSPTWDNITAGHRALAAAARGELQFRSESGAVKRPHEGGATLTVRPRGLHLPEPRVVVDGVEVAATLFDLALLALHMAKARNDRGTGLYLYIPKIENHHEAQWWDAVLADVERRCLLPANSIRVTVLIEHVLAAFEMDEILFAFRERVTGLNAGRWDYLFSLVREFGRDPAHVLPDRAAVTMQAPFMAAYSQRLVATCHRRGAYAIGGMSAFIPDRSSPASTAHAIAQVHAEKLREATLGYDGAWVAHPDLVHNVREVFDGVLGQQPNQLDVIAAVGQPAELIDTRIEDAHITPEGFSNNIRVALLYTMAWLRGNGAVAIDTMMEDAATAEIARCQIWQWIHHRCRLSDGSTATAQRATDLLADVAHKLVAEGEEQAESAAAILSRAMLAEDLPPFLTLLALPYLRD